MHKNFLGERIQSENKVKRPCSRGSLLQVNSTYPDASYTCGKEAAAHEARQTRQVDVSQASSVSAF